MVFIVLLVVIFSIYIKIFLSWDKETQEANVMILFAAGILFAYMIFLP